MIPCLICLLNGKACSYQMNENREQKLLLLRKKEEKTFCAYGQMTRTDLFRYTAILHTLALSLSCYFAMQSESYLCLGTKSPLPWNSISVSRSTGSTENLLLIIIFLLLLFETLLFSISSLIASHFSVCTVQRAFAQCAGTSKFPGFFSFYRSFLKPRMSESAVKPHCH